MTHMEATGGYVKEIWLVSGWAIPWLRLFSSQTFSHMDAQHFSNLVILHLPAYEDEAECSETVTYRIQTPGNYAEESIQHRIWYFEKWTDLTGLIKFLPGDMFIYVEITVGDFK